MEIVSVFCFGEDVRNLDADVFEMLMRFVTTSQSTCETKEFSPFPEFGMDRSPVVRSFLLQQLINSRLTCFDLYVWLQWMLKSKQYFKYCACYFDFDDTISVNVSLWINYNLNEQLFLSQGLNFLFLLAKLSTVSHSLHQRLKWAHVVTWMQIVSSRDNRWSKMAGRP